uniref:ATP synthase subunit gamma, mitochondrial n=1 Tax=Elaeis guineensis var. tenera TaxID=51953 RepID=A0A6I9RB03_ELAGV|nr:ATP synthase subunit gamma, mitochondrial isoform X2 [Elaeis guineensis]
MAMTALRREGRRFLLSPIPPNPSTAARSTMLSESTAYEMRWFLIVSLGDDLISGEVPKSNIHRKNHGRSRRSFVFVCSFFVNAGDLSLLGIRSISTQVVRNRMKSVKNIQKITKAMKMVAASKLRAVQLRTENSRGLWQPFTALLGDTPSVDVKKNVIVTITSDKGLCGGINSTSVKISKSLYKLTSGPEKETKYVLLGEKGKVQMVRDSKNSIEMTITEVQKNPVNYTQVSVLADDILKNVEYDALRIIFNKFHSVVSFIPTISTILSPEVVERESESGGKLGDLDSYEIEGGETKAEVLQNLAEFQFSCVLYNAVLENACSELGARMSAMDSSSRNAGEMLDRLTLTYNRTRQASITTELIEIISGASALTG